MAAGGGRSVWWLGEGASEAVLERVQSKQSNVEKWSAAHTCRHLGVEALKQTD